MFLHTWRCQGPCEPSGYTTFMLNPHWGRAATGKKKKKESLCVYAHRISLVLSLCDPVDCGLPGFSVRQGVLQARTRVYWSVLVAIPF